MALTTADLRYASGAGVATVIVAVGASYNPLLGLGALAAVPAVLLALRVPAASSAILLLVAVPLMRPMILGERLSSVAAALALGACLLAWTDDQRRVRTDRAGRSLALWTCTLWAWITLSLATHTSLSVGDTARGWLTVPVIVVAATVVLRSQGRRTMVLKGLLGTLLVLCGSYAVTYVLWRLQGYQFGVLTKIPAGYEGRSAPLYAPFTPTYSTVSIGGIPRFLGLAREPGIMGAFLGWAWFMLPRVGWNRRVWKALLIAGLLGTQSTAGFGVFLVVWVTSHFLLREGQNQVLLFLRRFIGVFGLAAAAWVAWYAPVFGYQAKLDFNEVSVDDRTSAMQRGLAAVTHHPWGQDLVGTDAANGAINMVAAIAVYGVPAFVLGLLALVRPSLLSGQRSAALAPTAVVVGTVLLSQPLTHSTALFLAVALAAATYDPTASDVVSPHATPARVHEPVG
jgi:hypothetical protein